MNTNNADLSPCQAEREGGHASVGSRSGQKKPNEAYHALALASVSWPLMTPPPIRDFKFNGYVDVVAPLSELRVAESFDSASAASKQKLTLVVNGEQL